MMKCFKCKETLKDKVTNVGFVTKLRECGFLTGDLLLCIACIEFKVTAIRSILISSIPIELITLILIYMDFISRTAVHKLKRPNSDHNDKYLSCIQMPSESSNMDHPHANRHT